MCTHFRRPWKTCLSLALLDAINFREKRKSWTGLFLKRRKSLFKDLIGFLGSCFLYIRKTKIFEKERKTIFSNSYRQKYNASTSYNYRFNPDLLLTTNQTIVWNSETCTHSTLWYYYFPTVLQHPRPPPADIFIFPNTHICGIRYDIIK